MYLIKRKDRFFIHVGLYIDYDTILHFGSKTYDMFAHNQEVLISTIDDFANGRKTVRTEVYEKIDIATVYKRMNNIKKRNRKYHVIKNNCISFVLMCLQGGDEVSARDLIRGMVKYRIQPIAFLLR